MNFNYLFKQPFFEASSFKNQPIVDFFALRPIINKENISYEEMLVMSLHQAITIDSFKSLEKERLYPFQLREKKSCIDFDPSRIDPVVFHKHLKNYFYLGIKDVYLVRLDENLTRVLNEIIDLIKSN